ncbi:MAG: nodulation protein NfeD [Candidatus Eisenbacteria bacterium]
MILERRAKARRAIFPFALAALLALLVVSLVASACEAARVLELTIDDAIGPVSAGFLEDGLVRAEEGGFDAVVIALDTPGGLDISMRSMVKAILASPVPVIVYVSPSGAHAASAGLFIALAAPVVAMAPGTNIGAATPVSIGGGPASPDTTMAKKITNDTAAYVRSLAERWGRNADWAEQAVRDAVSLSAEDAVEANVADLVATDLDDLFAQLDGDSVEVAGGWKVLHLVSASVETREMNWQERFLSLIANPSLAYLLLLGGILGLAMELYHPGTVLPGTAGAICLILAFFALQQLPVNIAGVLLILLAVVFFGLEIKVPSYGVLSVGGIVSLVLGSLFLYRPESSLRVGWSVLAPTVICFSAFILFAVSMAARAQKRPRVSGTEGMRGEIGVAVTPLMPEGKIFVHGEYWNARTSGTVESGARVRVRSVEGLTAEVEPVERSQP